MMKCEYLSVELLLTVPLLMWLDSELENCTDLCEKEVMGLVFLAAIAIALIYTFGICDVPSSDCCQALWTAVIEGVLLAVIAYFAKTYLCPCLCD